MRALTIVLALLAVLVTWQVFGPPPPEPAATPPPGYQKAKGDALFAASYKQFSSVPVALRQFEGKPVIVYFWASWCVECRAEAKALNALRTRYRSSDLAVIGIGVDQSDSIARVSRESQLDFPVFVAGAEGIELSRRMGNLRGELPFVAAVDRQGLVSAMHLGKFLATTPEAMAMAALK